MFPKIKLKDILQLVVTIIIIAIAVPLLQNFSESKLTQIREQVPSSSSKQNRESFRGEIVEILSEKEQTNDFDGVTRLSQELQIRVTSGSAKGQEFTATKQVNLSNPDQKYNVGEQVVVQKDTSKNTDTRFYLVDKYRLGGIIWVLVGFAVLVLLMAGIKGISAFLSLIFSLLVLLNFLVPQILLGGNIILLTFFTSIIIGSASIFMSHGLDKRTSVAVSGLVISITLATLFADWAVDIAQLSGLVSDENFYLQATQGSQLNFQGLLLASLIVGSIGVLDDVATAQAASVQEIAEANPQLSTWELFTRGMRVGREHIISMVNTLAFAYVGSNLSLMLLFALFEYNEVWFVLNRELVAEEIIRTVVGSIALILAVPITTLLAAKILQGKQTQEIWEKIYK